MFDIREAELILEVVRRGGFRAAAQNLGIAQSAVSSRVSALERRLGIAIFDRARRRVRLTAAGRRFVEEAARLIALRDRIAGELAPRAGYAGTVRIGVAETIVHTLLPTMLQHLRAAAPALRLELSVDTSPALAANLTNEAIDVAVLMTRLAPSAAATVPVASYAMGWFAAPGLLSSTAPLAPAELARHPIVTFSKGTLPHREVEGVLADPELPTPLLHGSASLSTMIHLVRDGFGLGTLPLVLVEADLAAGRLVQVGTAPEARLSALDFAVCHLARQERAFAEVMIDAAREAGGCPAGPNN